MHPTAYTTQQGTRYLKEPGVVLYIRPDVDQEALIPFLEDFGFEKESQASCSFGAA